MTEWKGIQFAPTGVPIRARNLGGEIKTIVWKGGDTSGHWIIEGTAVPFNAVEWSEVVPVPKEVKSTTLYG